MKPTIPHYEYKSTWKALPIDGSAQEWANEFGCSRLTINAALKAIEKEGPKEDSLYQQIRQSRRTSREKAGNADNNKADTHPGKYYWELKPLIRALSQARKAKRGLSGDDLAEGAFQRLAAELLNDDLTRKSFHQIQLVNNRCVRERVLQKFQTEVTTRLEAIEFLTTHKPNIPHMDESELDNVLIERIQVACESLDTLLYKLLLIPNVEGTSVDTLINRSLRAADIETNGHKRATVADIFDLYAALIAQRPHTSGGEYSDDDIITEFSVPDESIIAELKDALGSIRTPQNRSLEPKVRERIECAYERYLLATMPSEEKNHAELFLGGLSEWKEFVEARKDFQYYISQLEKSLYEDVSSAFREIERLDRIDLAYKSDEASTLEAKAFTESITNLKQHMRFNIHGTVTQLLRVKIAMELTPRAISQPSINGILAIQIQKMENLYKLMQDEYQKLAQESNLPLGDRMGNMPVNEFVIEYNKQVCPTLNSLINEILAIQTQEVENLIKLMQDEYQKLAQESNLPLGDRMENLPVNEFVTEYNKQVCPALNSLINEIPDSRIEPKIQTQEMENLIKLMQDEYQKLAQESNLPLGDRMENLPVNEFVTEYNKQVCPALNSKELKANTLRSSLMNSLNLFLNWQSGINILKKQESAVKILMYATKLVSVDYVNKVAIPELEAQHGATSRFYDKFAAFTKQ